MKDGSSLRVQIVPVWHLDLRCVWVDSLVLLSCLFAFLYFRHFSKGQFELFDWLEIISGCFLPEVIVLWLWCRLDRLVIALAWATRHWEIPESWLRLLWSSSPHRVTTAECRTTTECRSTTECRFTSECRLILFQSRWTWFGNIWILTESASLLSKSPIVKDTLRFFLNFGFFAGFDCIISRYSELARLWLRWFVYS